MPCYCPFCMSLTHQNINTFDNSQCITKEKWSLCNVRLVKKRKTLDDNDNNIVEEVPIMNSLIVVNSNETINNNANDMLESDDDSTSNNSNAGNSPIDMMIVASPLVDVVL